MLTIIYPYRNRDAERVRRSLDSLKKQCNTDFKVLFVDYGSNLIVAKEIKQLISNYNFVSYIYNFSEFQPWSRAKAINIGLKNVDTDFVFTADVDMIFSPDFILKLHELKNPLKAYYFKVGFLNRKESKIDKKFADYQIDFTTGVGAQGLSLFYLKNLEAIQGYDEFLHFWGAEDIDIHERLIRTGIESVFYDEQILLLHQWHDSYRKSEIDILSVDLQLKGIVKLNHQHLLVNKKINVTKINNEFWGNLISELDFNELENCNREIVLKNKVEVIDHFLFLELPRLKDEVLSFQFVEDTFQSSIKYKLKKLLGKNIPKYYSLKEINDMLLIQIVSFYHTFPYTYKVSKDLKSITFKIKK